MKSDISIKAELLQNTLIAYATSDSIETGDYEALRTEEKIYGIAFQNF